MIVGNKSTFAIEIDVVDIVDEWVFGVFLFWFQNKMVGNQDDRSTDLRGCLSWMKRFLSTNVDRFEPGLYEMDKGQLYIQLAESVILDDRQEVFFPGKNILALLRDFTFPI